MTNGVVGKLVKASEGKFVVTLQNDGHSREISFDPRAYRTFQLGYATTYYRSQGRTVDRAYILHSRQMNREMFYVGLTRHVRHVTCFVARETARIFLSDLKRQAFRKDPTETTADYLTHEQVREAEERAKRENRIEGLRQSDHLLERLKGQAFHAVDHLQHSAKGLWQRMTDRIPDKTFFLPTTKQETLGTVAAVVDQEKNDVTPVKVTLPVGASELGEEIVEVTHQHAQTGEQEEKLPQALKTLMDCLSKSLRGRHLRCKLS